MPFFEVYRYNAGRNIREKYREKYNNKNSGSANGKRGKLKNRKIRKTQLSHFDYLLLQVFWGVSHSSTTIARFLRCDIFPNEIPL